MNLISACTQLSRHTATRQGCPLPCAHFTHKFIVVEFGLKDLEVSALDVEGWFIVGHIDVEEVVSRDGVRLDGGTALRH